MFRLKKIASPALLIAMTGLLAFGPSYTLAQALDGCIDFKDYELVEYTLPDAWGYHDMIVSADHVYAWNYGAEELHVYDISDLTDPVFIDAIEIPGYKNGMTIEGELLYTSVSSVFRIFDISNPASIDLVGECGLPALGLTPAIGDNRAFLSAGSSGVMVVNTANPANPYFEHTINCGGTARGVASLGRYLAVYVLDHGLAILDLATHGFDEIALLDRVPTPYGMDLDDGMIYVHYSGGVTLVDVGNPLNPTVISDIENGYVWNVAVGDGLVVGGSDEGLFIYDVGQAFYPQLVTVLPAPQYRPQAIVDGHVVAINHDEYRTLSIIDMSTPLLPVQGHTELQAPTGELCVEDDLVYVLNPYYGLEILDVSDVDNPSQVSFLEDIEFKGHMVVLNGYVYATRQESWDLRILDVRNPSVPVEANSYQLMSEIADLKSDGEYLYMMKKYSNYTGELVVLNVDNPTAPMVMGSVMVPEALRMDLAGDTAYLRGGDGLFLVDISDATNPTVLSSTYLNYAQKVIAFGDYALVLGGYVIEVFDVSDRYFPHVVGVINLEHSNNQMVLCNDHLYLSHWRNRYVSVVDVTDPLAPIVKTPVVVSQEYWNDEISYYSGNHVLGVQDETVIFAGSALTALIPQCASIVTSVDGESDEHFAASYFKTGIVRSAPNPFNPQTTVSFQVQNQEHLSLAVYNVQGRLVQQLASGVYQPGEHQVTWRGRDQAGRRVSSGVYLIRMQGQRTRSSIRVSLLK